MPNPNHTIGSRKLNTNSKLLRKIIENNINNNCGLIIVWWIIAWWIIAWFIILLYYIFRSFSTINNMFLGLCLFRFLGFVFFAKFCPLLEQVPSLGNTSLGLLVPEQMPGTSSGNNEPRLLLSINQLMALIRKI